MLQYNYQNNQVIFICAIEASRMKPLLNVSGFYELMLSKITIIYAVKNVMKSLINLLLY
jgi:hypothetical protein